MAISIRVRYGVGGDHDGLGGGRRGATQGAYKIAKPGEPVHAALKQAQSAKKRSETATWCEVGGSLSPISVTVSCGVRQSLRFILANSDPQFRIVNITNRGDLKIDLEVGPKESSTATFSLYSMNL